MYSNRAAILFFVMCCLIFSNFVFARLADNYFLFPDSVDAKKSGFSQTGSASLYANKFQNKKTASGEPFNMHDYTAAHRSLKFGTYIKVTNLQNNKFVIVRVNDRGPFVKGRIIDVSQAAAKELGFFQQGTAQVKIETVSEPNPSNNQIDNNPLIAQNESQPLTRGILPQNNSADTKTSYSVQVGAFANPDNAEKLKIFLTDKKFKDINILKIKYPDTVLYKVFVGNFFTYEEANNHKEKLFKNNIDGFIIRNN